MSFIDTISPAQARSEVAAMYRRQQQAWGYVPNFAKVFCHRPEVMARWSALLAELKRPLDRRRLEMVTFVAAHQLGNSACALAHGRMLREFFSDNEIVAMAEGLVDSLLPAAERAMLRYARLVARDAAALAAARSFFTKLLDAMGVLPDAPFAELPGPLRDVLAVGRPIDDAPCVALP